MKNPYRYPIIVFLIWITSPLLLAALISLFDSILVSPKSIVFSILVPGIVFALISYGSTKIKDKNLRVGIFYSLIGISIWFSPAVYFLPTSPVYNSLPSTLRILLILIPTLALGILFFLLGSHKAEPDKDISDLYVKSYLYSNK